MAISVSGIGSNLDVDSIVEQLMVLERRPLTLLANEATATKTRISAFAQLKSLVSTFQSSMAGLTAERFGAVKASVADGTLATAAAQPGASAGTHTLEVVTLAQQHKLKSVAFPAATTPVGTGQLTFSFGAFDGATFMPDAARGAQSVVIGAGQATPAGIRDAVNAANIGVTATLVNDGTGERLVFTSTTAGSKSTLQVAVADNDGDALDASGLSQLAYDPAATAGSGRNLDQALAGLDATFRLDGILVAKPGNTVTDVLQGVTLALTKASPGTVTSLTIARDDAAVTGSVQTFVSAWNDVRRTLDVMTGYDAAQKKAGTLQGDSTALALQKRFLSVLTGSTSGPQGSLTRLAQVGITLQKDGMLSLDGTRLTSALAAPGGSAAVARLFSGTTSATDSRVSVLGTTSKTSAAAHEIVVTSAPTRGTLTGSSAAGLTITAGVDDTFSINVEGTLRSVTLAAGTYASAAALAAEVQSQLNGAGADIEVSESAGLLTISSKRYGSASTITSASGPAATLLFGATPVSQAGTDIAGTLGGVAAIGSGDTLAGAGGSAAEGLRVRVAASAIGALGTLQVGRGYADLLASAANDYLGSGTGISARVDGLNARLSANSKRQDAVNRRLEDVEKRMRAQFAALDTLMSKMSSTSTYLAQQLAALPGSSS